MQSELATPLVSVIIPCFNHGRYLQEAIDSVRRQEGVAAEIVVVDDGSTDNTAEVAKRNRDVVYVYQQNSGLSAARNTGIRNSKGAYLLFLDADDWLLPGALQTSMGILKKNGETAFVSGGHEKVFVTTGRVIQERQSIAENHYLHLLQGNYIGMHATVLYQRWVFNTLLFDETLRACEDYDLYLKIARKYPVLHHTELIAAYRIHGTNMSGNVPFMLRHVRLVLARQAPLLRTEAEKAALRNGLSVWKEYYAHQLLDNLKQGSSSKPFRDAAFMLSLQPGMAFHYFKRLNPHMIKQLFKKTAPAFSKRWVYKKVLHKEYRPEVGEVHPGDFFRRTPFSTEFGYDRGGPVDRIYIEQFLEKESGKIKGRVLEIGDNEYTLKYGGSNVSKSDILHVDAANPKATFVGDLSNAPQVPDNAFDCIILTQTLHLIYDYKAALATCHRILKPGGTLLLTVPGITPIDHGEWKSIWYWSFTDAAMKKLMAESFPEGDVAVQPFGNVYVATAFLYGMGSSEVAQEMYQHNDPHFQVIVTVSAQKAGA